MIAVIFVDVINGHIQVRIRLEEIDYRLSDRFSKKYNS